MCLCRASGTTLALEKEQMQDSVSGLSDSLIGFHLHFPEFQLHVCRSVWALTQGWSLFVQFEGCSL